MHLAVYISGHGFGHLAQVAPVLKRIHHIQPECRFFIRCALPEQEIRSQLRMDFELEQKPVDVGVIQRNAVQEDRQSSIQHMRHWMEHIDDHISEEIAWLKRIEATQVLSDISPLAFPAAQALHIPSIGLATLDWHTIYSHWLDADDPLLHRLANAYRACDLLLTPPMAMDMPIFPSQQQIPLIVTQAANKTNPFSADPRKKALILFGGCGNPPYDLQALANMPDWLFLTPCNSAVQINAMPDTPNSNIQAIHFDTDLRPIDAMQWADVVVCKPGYGVLSEAWATTTPIAWLERPDFPEFPMLKRWLETAFPAAGMKRADFQRGDWQLALETAFENPTCFPASLHDGAAVAADIILFGQDSSLLSSYSK